MSEVGNEAPLRLPRSYVARSRDCQRFAPAFLRPYTLVPPHAGALTRTPADPYNERVVAASSRCRPWCCCRWPRSPRMPGPPSRRSWPAWPAPTVTDLAIEQTFTLYHPDGRHPQSSGEQRVWIKMPRRQRVEQVDGRPARGASRRRRPGLDPHGRRQVSEAPGRARARPHPPAGAVPPLGGRRAGRVALARRARRREPRHPRWAAARSPSSAPSRASATPRRCGSTPSAVSSASSCARSCPSGEGMVDLTFSEHRPLAGGLQFPVPSGSVRRRQAGSC